MPLSRPVVPEPLHGLVDDAALFPPGNAPLDAAVPAHAGHRLAPYAALVGTFVVADTALPRLAKEAASAALDPPLSVAVVVSGGAGALEPAVTWVTRSEHLVLRAVEVAVRESDAGDLAPNSRRVLTAVDALLASGVLDEDVAVYLEPPRLHGAAPSTSWLGVLDEVASMDLRVKLRTGGADAEAHPGADELATCITAVLDRELAFKCTAGLRHAVRHRDPGTGFEQHGFLNVLAATRAALDGGGPADVAAVLEDRDASRLAEVTRTAGSARSWFRSFGSCSVHDAVRDLTALELLDLPA